jgi:hypothetical protein
MLIPKNPETDPVDISGHAKTQLPVHRSTEVRNDQHQRNAFKSP